MTVDEIEVEAQSIQDGFDALKRQAMIYQYNDKVEAAKHFGLTFDEVNKPFEEWMAIRRKWKQEVPSSAP